MAIALVSFSHLTEFNRTMYPGMTDLTRCVSLVFSTPAAIAAAQTLPVLG
ncbi:MAG: hypothetical protein LH647_14135 [Leptolyngbyaceae cyanobacterium CAN_BIN12]|nr:hypothetical protein [Leptolyngbyaceae cyanobacterium CAN_BIN12]